MNRRATGCRSAFGRVEGGEWLPIAEIPCIRNALTLEVGDAHQAETRSNIQVVVLPVLRATEKRAPRPGG
jgi:hypothetical protein